MAIYSNSNGQNENKTIWFLWLQGKQEMPDLVARCLASWIRNNPDYRVEFLHSNNLCDYLNIQEFAERKKITMQALSDIVRINLLSSYGGVWADATVYCTRPIQEWLSGYSDSGFFAFSKPAPDRMISSWFLYGRKDNYIVSKWCEEVNNYWLTNPSIAPSGRSFIESLDDELRFKLRSEPTEWYSSEMMKTYKKYHYYWFHYLFAKLYKSDARFKNGWDSVNKYSADTPHKPQVDGFFTALTEEYAHYYKIDNTPMYKLTYQYDHSICQTGTILEFILTHK